MTLAHARTIRLVLIQFTISTSSPSRRTISIPHSTAYRLSSPISPPMIYCRARRPLRSSTPPGFPYVNTTAQRSRPEVRRPLLSESELGRASAVLRRDAGRAVLRALEEWRLGEDRVYARDE
jgi:hypothetical protein